MINPVCSIFFHNYYGSHASWMDYFAKTISFPSNLYYNMVEDSMYNLADAEKIFTGGFKPGQQNQINKVIVRQSSNKGKDIGGKMVLLDACSQLNLPTRYGLFLHDKKSPYKANNTTWTTNLLAIAEDGFSRKALRLFEDHPNTGIVTATGNTSNEYDHGMQSFKSNNNVLLTELQKRFAISTDSFQYVTGTMFWFRMEPISQFFKKYPPLQIREMLEQGNIMDEYAGTYTHSWERLLCWIITGQQYSIKTI